MGGLEGLLLSLGGPMLAKVIGKRFGADAAELTTFALEQLGGLFGAEPTESGVEEAIAAAQAADPKGTIGKVVRVEASLAAELAAYADIMRAGNDQQRLTNELLDKSESGWRKDWLYVWQWFLMAIWFWTLMLVHILNAAIRIATGASADQAVSLPAPDLGILMTLTGLYLGLHMGGHTVLELVRGQFGGLFAKKGSTAVE